MEAPTAFNIHTATEDFAGEGRTVECPVVLEGEEEDSRYARRQVRIRVNGWVFSAVWGFDTYCTAGRDEHGPPPAESPDAELAAWKGEAGPMIDLHGGDSVEGWVSPASVLAAIEAAERDDEDGIRAALVRTDES